MRRVANKVQTLTTGRENFNKQRIPSNVIKWDDYDKNPVLLYNASTEGHGGVVVGRVVEREQQGDRWFGKLEFMENVEAADVAYEKYAQGALNYVSIGGFAAGKTVDGVFVAASYIPREFSLVKHPANIDCAAIDVNTLEASEKEFAESLAADGLEVRYLNMSMDVTEDDETRLIEAEEAERVRLEAEEAERVRLEAEEAERVRLEAEEKARIEAEEKARIEAEEKARIEAEEKARLDATGLQWHNRNINNPNNKGMILEFKKLNCDEDFQKRLGALNMAIRTGAPVTDPNPDNLETVRILAESMINDTEMVMLASVTNLRFGSAEAPAKNALEFLVECAAGGAAAATLAAADLGVIKYLSLYYEQLRANDTFRRSVRFVPMSDRTGAIYIESGIKAPIYVGNVTPRNVPNYFYDDIKRTIARKVFAFQPIVFEHADLAVLAYNKQSLGTQDQISGVMEKVSTFWINSVGNTPGVQKVYTSGDKVSSQGLFPIEAPNSNVQISKPTIQDIIANQGRFLMQNYSLNGGQAIEMVLPANVFSMLVSDKEIRDANTLEMEARISAQVGFSATRVTPRNPAVRYNTSSDQPELDPSMYADFNTADDGTATPIDPAVTTADHVGAGISFIRNGILAGVSAMEIISVPDPNNYGTKLSGWLATGCTVARQNGVGASLIIPNVN